MITVDLSIDFDFFIREDLMWDFGHRDAPFFREMIWQLRYSSIDLFEGTSIEAHADCHPKDLMEELFHRGLDVTLGREGRVLGVAESHIHAYQFFIDRLVRDGPASRLISIDAHHDWFHGLEEGYVDCGNWLKEYASAHQIMTGAVLDPLVVYPGWKNPKEDGVAAEGLYGVAKWPTWVGYEHPVRLRHIFICRSGAWVPPHHDATFAALVEELEPHATETLRLEPTEPREAPTPEEAEVWRETHREQFQGFLSTRSDAQDDGA